MIKITEGTVQVFTYRDGLLSRLGHDLQLTLERFEIELDDDRATLLAWPASLRLDGAVRAGTLGDGALSAKDRRDILDNTAKLLKSARHPQARLDAQILPAGDGRHRVEGRLELAGRTADISFVVRDEDGRLRGEVNLTPTRWGIAPFKALLGALKLQDRVDVRFDLPAPSAD